jgi:hypothetical protein
VIPLSPCGCVYVLHAAYDLQEAGDELAVLGCKHHGHMDTMLQWLETKGSCPICRSQDLRLDTVRTDLMLHPQTSAPLIVPATDE